MYSEVKDTDKHILTVLYVLVIVCVTISDINVKSRSIVKDVLDHVILASYHELEFLSWLIIKLLNLSGFPLLCAVIQTISHAFEQLTWSDFFLDVWIFFSSKATTRK